MTQGPDPVPRPRDPDSFGILGGTFDPMHLAHLAAAREVQERLGLELVYIVPCGNPPHKTLSRPAPATDRLRMAELAARRFPGFQVSSFEVDRPEPSYTLETVRHFLGEPGPDRQCWIIIGIDAVLELETWRDPGELVRLCRFAVVNRPGYDADALDRVGLIARNRDRFRSVDIPQMDISATDIRRRLKRGGAVGHLVPEPVEAYIRDHGLYSEH